MQAPEEIRRDLPPDLEREESDRLVATALRLQSERPVPAPGFRGALRRRLTGVDRVPARSPRRYRALAAAYGMCGGALLAVAAIGLAGAGPFAAG